MSEFLSNTAADFLGSLLAGIALAGIYVAIQWFLAATDVEVGYGWKFHGTVEAPTVLQVCLDVRNRSRTRTYYVGNIAYLKDDKPIAGFDNTSVWDRELKPGTINFITAAPVRNCSDLRACMEAEVHVRLQNGRQFWLRGTGTSQQRRGLVERLAFWLRSKIEAGAIPME
jgi:hypothetical protein